MNERELSLIKALGEEFGVVLRAMKDDFAKSLEEQKTDFDKKIADLRESIPEIELPDFSKMVAEAVGRIELPQPQELPDIAHMIVEAVQSSVKEVAASIRIPEDGKSVTVEEIRPLVEEVVSASLPEPVDVEKLAEDVAAKIPAPESGSDGRDALAIEIEPFIDEKKSYPRGTYATHNGGLWRSHEKTYGMRGWECIVDGVSAVDIQQDNERSFSITLERASGALEVKSFDVPVTIYRDVFKSGNEYKRGDTVTWGGSLWHCNEATSDKPGEVGSKGWTLAVKKGRDLRDKP